MYRRSCLQWHWLQWHSIGPSGYSDTSDFPISQSYTEEVASEESKDEENLADELKELSDTMSSEVDNDKK